MRRCVLCGRTENEDRIIDSSKAGLVCERCYQRVQRNSKVYPLPGYGEIAYSPDGKPICHICGKAYKKPLTHAWQIHGLTEKEYKKEFGLDVTVGILSEESRELARKRVYENYDVAIAENLLKKGKKTRFKKGSQGRVKEKVSEQTRRALVERIKNAKKGSRRGSDE
jgi:hypothetical protein